MRVARHAMLAVISILAYALYSYIDFTDNRHVYDFEHLELNFGHDAKEQPKGYLNKTYNFVLHTHNDPGWILTMEEYERLSVDQIISEMVDTLQEKKGNDHKFSYTDISFLHSWIVRNPERKEEIKQLIKRGQLEILNGGISMHDQACTYFDEILNNYEYGREYSKNVLGILPTIGWSIDPFGPSRTSARLFAEMGYDVLGLNRMSYTQKLKMKHDKNMIFNWNNSDVSPATDMMTYLLAQHYSTPDPLNFHKRMPHPFGDVYPVVDITSNKFNLMSKLMIAFGRMDTSAYVYQEQHILMLLGDDFAFTDFKIEAEIIEAMISSLRSNSESGRLRGNRFEVTNLYQFFQKVRDENLSYSTLTLKDAFPLITVDLSEGETPWVGFYTTRPELKWRIKQLGYAYRAATAVVSRFALQRGSIENITMIHSCLEDARFVLGIVVHHDAITGTCFQHVAEDYMSMINRALGVINSCLKNNIRGIKPALDFIRFKPITYIEWHPRLKLKIPSNPLPPIAPTLMMHDEKTLRRVKKKSGAYIMITINSEPIKLPGSWNGNTWSHSLLPSINLTVGQMHSVGAAWVYNVTLTMDPLLLDEEADYVLRYQFSLHNDALFKVDSNGLELVEHKYNPDKKIELNYQPITKLIQIQDVKTRDKVTILTDRAQGGTSPADGMIEIAVNRVNFGRDNQGLNQHLHEPHKVKIVHIVVLENSDSFEFRRVQLDSDSQGLPVELPESSEGIPVLSIRDHLTEINTHLRILSDVRPDGIMVRLYNMHDTQNITINDIKDFLKNNFLIPRDFFVEERSLDYNQPIQHVLDGRYLWRNNTAMKEAYSQTRAGGGITLLPLNMATFKINFT